WPELRGPRKPLPKRAVLEKPALPVATVRSGALVRDATIQGVLAQLIKFLACLDKTGYCFMTDAGAPCGSDTRRRRCDRVATPLPRFKNPQGHAGPEWTASNPKRPADAANCGLARKAWSRAIRSALCRE